MKAIITGNLPVSKAQKESERPALDDLLDAYIRLYRWRFPYSNPYDDPIVKRALRELSTKE